MFIAALFTIVKMWEQPKYPPQVTAEAKFSLYNGILSGFGKKVLTYANI
jgi:hypothetical protein